LGIRQQYPIWCEDYRRFQNPKADLVEVNTDANGASFNYLFDIEQERNIVAFGIPVYAKHKRDASRMRGHPLLNDSRYHRGHLMAHSIGGDTDINLVPQLGKLNVGQFRVLEKQARKLAEENVQCLYFVRTLYSGTSQIPSAFEQCVIHASKEITYALHAHL
jgi:DNA/RNA non-specific endonuclease